MAQLLLCVLCDDVRTEIGGKHSLMELFDHVRVIDFSQPLPRFFMYAKVAVDREGDHPVVVRLRGAPGDFAFQMSGRLHATERNDPAQTRCVSTILLTLSGIRVPGPGVYRVDVQVDGEDLCGTTFRIEQVAPPQPE